jgi:hypothetical protein
MKGDIIPNGEILFKYIKPQSLPDDQSEIPFTIFEDESLSCDWELYQKEPEKSFHIKEGKNIIIAIAICDDIKFPKNPKQSKQHVPAWEQQVIHDPIEIGEDLKHPNISNFSHSLINGLKKKAVTTAIAQNSKIYKTVKV